MRNRIIIPFFFIVFLGVHFLSIAQFTQEELAERSKWEEFLKDAKVVSFYQQKSREAVTEPWTLTLEKDGIKRNALWKDVEGRSKGSLENWKWEIAAYRLDKYLGLNMVSPTVERRFQGNRGSCQLYAEYWMKATEKNEKKIKVPSYKIDLYNKATYLRWAFDNLIANEDRHSGNIFITKDWRIILPDHSRSFRTSRKFTEKLIYTEKNKERPKIMKELPRAFVEKLKSLNFELISDIVGEYLTEKEINAVILRRGLILKVIDERIKELGEDKVLY
ncbi:MAG: hypothetical protein ISS41_09550 [Candidatus Aminicenantes bacterium]|nr:hypothetical protein [Candidatus Aminicenantes bacterium]MBL7083855.1 hypothetical protein [Candidatus Aminicenantes bacterium]